MGKISFRFIKANLIAYNTLVKVTAPLLYSTDSNYCPVIFNIARTTNRPSTSRAALSIRISCVLGSMNFHTEAQRAAMSDMRKTKNTMSRNIH